MTDKRIDSLTGIRGTAALLVVIAHICEAGMGVVSPLYPGEIGVAVFFSLSGFLMAFLYLGRPFNLKSVQGYVISRASRIAPGYLFVVLMSFFICTFVDSEFIFRLTSSNIVRHLLFSGNVSALWSIPPEVQFYAVFLVLWFSCYFYSSRGSLSYLLLLAVLMLALVFYRSDFPGTFVGSHIHFFMTGVIAGALRASVDGSESNTKGVLYVQVLVGVVVLLGVTGILNISLGTKKEFYSGIPAGISAAFFIFLFSFRTSLGKILFENKFLITCGAWSFSIYLLNLPVIYVASKTLPSSLNSATQVMIILVGIAAVSWANYRFIEMPGARLIKSFSSGSYFDPLKPEKQRPADAHSGAQACTNNPNDAGQKPM